MTESALAENATMAETLILELKALRVGIALDHFDTNYSLFYLHMFKCHPIKIVRSFVQSHDPYHERRRSTKTPVLSQG